MKELVTINIDYKIFKKKVHSIFIVSSQYTQYNNKSIHKKAPKENNQKYQKKCIN